MRKNHFQSEQSGFETAGTVSGEVRLPSLEAQDLNGNKKKIPHDLPAKKTLVLLAFEREQQCAIDSWIEGLELRSSKNELAWIEVPLLNNAWKLLESWIDQGMKRGITDPELRAHVWTVYTHRKSFLKTIGLTSAKTIYAMAVSKEGAILELVSGDYSETTAHAILEALK